MPDDGERIEQLFHIEAMKGELEELAQGPMTLEISEGAPPELTEQFLAQTLAYERAELVSHEEQLARDGVALPPAEELTDEEVSLKLIEVIHALAAHRTYLESTDHLSDRELYTHLRTISLEESTPDLPPDYPMNCHIDIIGGCSDDDIAIWLTYYADEQTRERWVEQFPDYVLPPHQEPPYDRDRRLPTPPPPENPYDDPEVEAAFCARCCRRLEQDLAADDVLHGPIDAEPLSYAPDLGCVWAVPRLGSTDPAWWAISGDLPTVYLPVADYPSPRAFLHAVSARLHAEAQARTAERDEESFAPNWLSTQADILAYWADDEEAWDEEWR